MSRKLIMAIVATLFVASFWAVLFLLKITVEVTPECRVKVVDYQGSPKGGVELFESWEHYSYDGVVDPWSGEERLVTDGSGLVTFKRKTIKIGLLDWIKSRIKIIEAIIYMNMHASFGPDANIITVNYTSEGVLFDEILAAYDENRIITVKLEE